MSRGLPWATPRAFLPYREWRPRLNEAVMPLARSRAPVVLLSNLLSMYRSRSLMERLRRLCRRALSLAFLDAASPESRSLAEKDPVAFRNIRKFDGKSFESRIEAPSEERTLPRALQRHTQPAGVLVKESALPWSNRSRIKRRLTSDVARSFPSAALPKSTSESRSGPKDA